MSGSTFRTRSWALLRDENRLKAIRSASQMSCLWEKPQKPHLQQRSSELRGHEIKLSIAIVICTVSRLSTLVGKKSSTLSPVLPSKRASLLIGYLRLRKKRQSSSSPKASQEVLRISG